MHGIRWERRRWPTIAALAGLLVIGSAAAGAAAPDDRPPPGCAVGHPPAEAVTGRPWFRLEPVLVGGGGERKTLRIVAEHANIWHGFGGPQTIAHKHSVLDEWCRKVGRDPAEIERSAGVSPKPGRLPEDVRDYAGGAEGLYAVGTRLFTVGIGGPRYDLGPLRDLVAWRDSRQAA